MSEVMRDKDVTALADTRSSAMMFVWDPIDRDPIDVRELQPVLVEKPAHRLLAHGVLKRQARIVAEVGAGPAWRGPTVVLLAVEALLFDRRDDLTVDHERSAVMFTGGDR